MIFMWQDVWQGLAQCQFHRHQQQGEQHGYDLEPGEIDRGWRSHLGVSGWRWLPDVSGTVQRRLIRPFLYLYGLPIAVAGPENTISCQWGA